jgi:hypothetical protein
VSPVAKIPNVCADSRAVRSYPGQRLLAEHLQVINS